MARQNTMTLGRLTLLAPLAAGLTFSLFIFMQVLIRADVIPVEEPSFIPEINFNWVPDDEYPDRQADIDDLEPVVAPPLIDTLEFVDDQGATPDDMGGYSRTVLIDETRIDHTGMNLVIPRVPTPVYRVEPQYPRAEAARGEEGECTVFFDILASGETANIRTMRCDTSGFQQASVRAVSNWRYTAYPEEPANTIVIENTSVTLTFAFEDQ